MLKVKMDGKDWSPNIKLSLPFLVSLTCKKKRWNMVLDIVIHNSPLSKQSLSLPLYASHCSPNMKHSHFLKWGGCDPSSFHWRSYGFGSTQLQERVLTMFPLIVLPFTFSIVPFYFFAAKTYTLSHTQSMNEDCI